MVVTKGLPDPPGRGAEAKARVQSPSEGDEPAAKPPPTGCLGFILKVLKFIAEQWLIIGFGLACLFGYLWPGKRSPNFTCAEGGICED